MNLKSISELLERHQSDPMNMSADEQDSVMSYLQESERVGSDLMSRLTIEEQIGSIAAIETAIMLYHLNRGDMNSVLEWLMNKKANQSNIAIALKMSVGMAAIEEWR